VKLVDVIKEREFYTRHGQHQNSRSKESIASKIAQTVESIMMKKADLISMKWYDGDEINNQDRKHLQTGRQRSDTITTSTVHNVNIVTRT
jgi:hypothetical protein